MDFSQLWSSKGKSPGPDEFSPRTYDLNGSLLFESANNMNCQHTRAGSNNANKVTVSQWIRRTVKPLQDLTIFTFVPDSGGLPRLWITADGRLTFWENQDNSSEPRVQSKNIFYDNAGWYHIVVRLDSTQADNTERIKVFVNNKAIELHSSQEPNQNYQFNLCKAGEMNWSDSSSHMRMAAPCMVQGAYDPSAFGQYDGLGQWRPIFPNVTFGQYDGYWDFASESEMHMDRSGNGNDISISGGETGTSMPAIYRQRYSYDSPTSTRGQLSYLMPYLTRVDNGASRMYNPSGVGYAESTHGFQHGGRYKAEFQSDTIAGREAWAGSFKTRLNGNSGGYGFWCKQGHGDAGESLMYFYESNPTGGGNDTSQFNTNNTDPTSSCTTGFNSFSWSASSCIQIARDEVGNHWSLTDTNGKNSCYGATSGNLIGPDEPGYWDQHVLNHRWSGSSATTAYMHFNFGCSKWYEPQAISYGPYDAAKSDGHILDNPVYDGKFYSDVVLGAGADIKDKAVAAVGVRGMIIIKDRENAGQAQIVDSIRGYDNAFEMLSLDPTKSYVAPSGNSVAVWFKETEDFANGFQMVEYTGDGSAVQVINHDLGRRPNMIWIKAKTQDGYLSSWTTNMGNNSVQKPGASDNSRQSLENMPDGGFRQTSGVSNDMTRDTFAVGTTNSSHRDTNADGVDYIAYIWAPCDGYCTTTTSSLNDTYSTDGVYSWNGNNMSGAMGFKPRFVFHIGPGGTSTAGYCYLMDTQRRQPNLDTDLPADLIDLWGTETETVNNGWYWASNGLHCKNLQNSNMTGNTTITIGWAEVPLWGMSCSPSSPFS
jgi:hypothetical protein